METYVSVAITNFTSFTAYYNDGESSTQSPVQVKKDSFMFINIDLGGPGPIPTASGDVSIVTPVSYTHLDVYKRQRLIKTFTLW